MTVVIESPRGRVAYDNVEAAAIAFRSWLTRETASGRPCVSITVSVHAADEACDHEVKP